MADNEFQLPIDLAIDVLDSFAPQLASQLRTAFGEAFSTAVKGLPSKVQSQLKRTMENLGKNLGGSFVGGLSEGALKQANTYAKTMERIATIGAQAFIAQENRLIKESSDRLAGIRSREAGLTKRAKIAAPARQTSADAALASGQAKLNESVFAGTRANARYNQTIANRINAETGLERKIISQGNSERALARQREVTVGRRIAAPIESERTAQLAERARLNRLNNQDRIASATAIQQARANAAIEIAETQQTEKRKSLRLQRFNAIAVQVTQAGLTKIRDARRIGAQREIQDQVSSDKRAERQLKESLSRRETTIRKFEQKQVTLRSKSTQALVDARTSTGILGAARGASPLGSALRSLAFIGGGALSIRAIFQAGQDFLANFRRLGAITNATNAQLKALRQTAIDLGNDLSLPGVSAADATDALTKLVQAGFSVDNAIGSAKGVLLLARNNLIDFGDSAQFVGSQINAFGVASADAIKLVDVTQKSLVAGGGQSFQEFSDAITQAGSAFSLAFKNTRGGVAAFQDMSIALDVLAKNGLRGADAGNALKVFLLNSVPVTKAAKKMTAALDKKLGFDGVKESVFQSNGQLRPFLDIVRNLRDSMAGLSQTQQIQTLKTIFGTRAFRAAGFLIQQTDEQLAALEDQIRNSAGASDALGRAVNQGMRAAFDNFSSVVETAGILLIEKIDKPLGRVINEFANLTSSLIQGTGVYREIRAALAGMAVALAAILAAKGAVEVMGLFKATLIGLTSPANAAVVAIAAIGAAFGIGIQSSDEFRQSLGNLADFVKTTVLQPLELLRETLFPKQRHGAAVGPVSEPGDLISRQTKPHVVRTNPVFDAIGRSINRTVIPALRRAVTFIRETLIPTLAGIGRFITERVLPIIGSIGTLIANVALLIATEVSTHILPTLEKIGAGFHAGFDGITQEGQASGILGFLQDVARAVGGIGKAISLFAQGRFGEAFSRLSDLARSIGGALLEAVRGIDFTSIAKTLFNLLGVAARKAGSALTTIFSEPVIKAVLAAAAAAAAVVGQVVTNFVIGFVKGMKGRTDDISRVLVDVLSLAGKAALLALGAILVKGLPALLKLALSGPLGAIGALIAVALGAKLLNKIRTGFFQPFVEQSKAAFLTATGHVEQAQAGYANFLAEQNRVRLGADATKRSLGGGVFAGFITGAGKAVAALGKLTDAGAGQAVAAGIATYVGAWQGGFAQIISLAGAAALALQQLPTNPLGAGLTVAVAAIGFALGSMARKAREAQDRIREFTAGLKDGTTAAEGFTTGLQAIIDKDKGLQDALAATGLSASTFLGSLLGGGSAAKVQVVSNALGGIQAAIDAVDVGSTRSQLIALGDALPSGFVEDFVGDLARLKAQFDATGGDVTSAKALSDFAVGAKTSLLDAAAGAKSAGKEIQEVIDEVLTAISKSSLKSALSLDTSKIAKDFIKVRSEATDFGAAIQSALPADLQLQFERIASSLGVSADKVFPDLTKAVTGSAAGFEDFRITTLNALVPLGATQRESTAVDIALQALRTAFIDSAEGARLLAQSTEEVRRKNAELARQKRLDQIRSQWDGIEQSTRDAIAALDTYLGRATGGNVQNAIDTAIVAGQQAIEGFTQFVKDHPGIDVNSLFAPGTGGVLGSQFRTDVAAEFQKTVSDLIANLPDAVKEDPALAAEALRQALNPIIKNALAAGIDPTVLAGFFTVTDILKILQPFQDAAEERGRLMAEAFRAALTPQTVLSLTDLNGALPEFAPGAKPFVDVQAVLSSLKFDDASLNQFIKDNPVQAVAELNKVIVDQTATDTAMKDAVAAAQGGLPPIQVKATITGVTVSPAAIQGLRLQLSGPKVFNVNGFTPGTAEGGIFTTPQVRTFAEGGKAEVAIPLTKPKRALSLLRASGLDRLLLSGTMGALNLAGAGSDIGAGAAVGISQSRGLVARATAGLASTIQSTFTSILGIRSPSTVFEKYGRDIIDGLIKGLNEGAQAAGDSIKGFVDILFGRTAAGGATATGIGQLVAAVKAQVVETLKSVGVDTTKNLASGQSSALTGIADLAKNTSPFKKGLANTTTAGAENRSTLIDVVATARDAIVEDLAAGDKTGAKAVLDQLKAALAKVGKANKTNASVITEILTAFGLGGKDPIAETLTKFADATAELNKLIDAETARLKAQELADRTANTPAISLTNANTIIAYDPLLLAQRLARENQKQIEKALAG